MKYYVLDDDENVVKILRNIIETDYNRQVVGFSSNPLKALNEISIIKPDVVIIDYLMPSLDGVDVIKNIKQIADHIEFVMVSQVADKDMIASAYKEGLSFFISKPINKIEVGAVLDQIEVRIKTSRKLNQIVTLIGESTPIRKQTPINVIKNTLRDIGIYSEKGTKDILSVVSIKQEKDNSVEDAIKIYSKLSGEKTKSVRQRMRRAVMKGLRNIAYLGVEDYMSEIFVRHSSSLYEFETVKKEMDYVRGKSPYKGSVSVDRFIENLCDSN